MEAFSHYLSKAIELVSQQRDADAEQMRMSQHSQSEAEARDTRARELAQVVNEEARIVAKAMLGVKNVQTYRAVPVDIMRQEVRRPFHGKGGPSQRQLNAYQARKDQLLSGNQFPVWDLDSGWSFTQPDEPYERESESYLLGRDGNVWCSSGGIRAIRTLDPDLFIGVTLFSNRHPHEEKLESVRFGLAKLVVLHSLQVEL